jgi:2-iminoacetate synthase
MTETAGCSEWVSRLIRPEEIERYLRNGRDFVDEELIWSELEKQKNPDRSRIRDIVAKSLSLKRLDPPETAALLNCADEDLWQEMYAAGLKVKQNVYGRRIVFFAPLYISNYCVNDCQYCGFRRGNKAVVRGCLTDEELRHEILALIRMGHKRLIMVYGEHPSTDADFIAHTIRLAYSVKEGGGEIRRVNVNAAPLGVEDFRKLKEVGIGTYQVFQETYHHETYGLAHPADTLKGNMNWRLYALHRAQEAGIDDVAIGALFGLYDYRFEVMGLLLHAIDLESFFGGVGPHTISFPRLEPAVNTPFLDNPKYRVSDEQFKKLVTVIRLSVPYTGLILTAREPAAVRRDVIPVGVTQIDAGSNIGIGGYADGHVIGDRQQFMLSDSRTLDEVVGELVGMDMITSFCTADYRCGRTGGCFMSLSKDGKIQNFCMPNAILTFAEYLEDFASPETCTKGWGLVEKELEGLSDPTVKHVVEAYLARIRSGERDLFL